MAGALGMKLMEGKRVFELAPSTSPSKGDVVRREGSGMEAVLYAGDDLADQTAFEAVDELAEAGVRTLKVAVSGAETPRTLIEAADITVEGPDGLLQMLGTLAG
jgi:trehalose 6-phosphate phosphatase